MRHYIIFFYFCSFICLPSFFSFFFFFNDTATTEIYTLSLHDALPIYVESVGGKNASLGEMISQLPQGVRVPTGFATTAHAFRQFLAHDGLADKISAKLAALDVEDVRALAQV